MSFKAAIFDLDGVIVNTVPLHFKAWKKMFDEYGKDFSFDDYKKKVDGIPRLDGARAILTDISDKELLRAAEKKQTYYLEYVEKEKIPVYEDAKKLIEELRSRGIKIAVISSSKNCSFILESINYYPLIDAEVNGNDITKGKPDPQIFLMAAEESGAKSDESIVFEDATLGVEAAKRGGFVCIGVDRHSDPSRLRKADLVVSNLGELDYNKLSRFFKK